MTQLPSELHPRAAALQSQVHSATLIDQAGAHALVRGEKVESLTIAVTVSDSGRVKPTLETLSRTVYRCLFSK